MSDVTVKKTAKRAANKSKTRKAKVKTNIIFVCTGNTCRSPMAEYIFKNFVKARRKSTLFNISSAGIYAAGGDPMTQNALNALKYLGVTALPRGAVLLTPALAESADLIVCMTSSHAQALASLGDKVKTVASLTGGPEVPDPFGGDLGVYIKTAEYLSYAAQDVFNAAMNISDMKNAARN